MSNSNLESLTRKLGLSLTIGGFILRRGLNVEEMKRNLMQS